MAASFSPGRVLAVLIKEFIQMRRDRVTLAMIVGVPVMQLFLFGFAINLDPRHLPTAIAADDGGVFSRSLTAALSNSDFFRVVRT
ncbi:MAG: ABC transporter permease, partial [Candidatus Acidiferrum sp.]